ncbi:hypothetical protein ACQP3J_33400, partial [Escherichia coli]
PRIEPDKNHKPKSSLSLSDFYVLLGQKKLTNRQRILLIFTIPMSHTGVCLFCRVGVSGLLLKGKPYTQGFLEGYLGTIM